MLSPRPILAALSITAFASFASAEQAVTSDGTAASADGAVPASADGASSSVATDGAATAGANGSGSEATSPSARLASSEATAASPSTSAAQASAAALDSADASTKSRPRYTLGFDGYLRVTLSMMTADRFFFVKTGDGNDTNPNVGRNDGFALGGARLNLRGTYGDSLYVRLGFDGSLVSYSSDNDPVGGLSTGLKDAYARYAVARELQIYAGRFKPPFDIEELTPEAEQLFVHRSLESRGVVRNEGFATDMQGFAPGRQLGLMVAGEDILGGGPLALDYAVAVTNGNSGERSLNDNDLPAVYGRVQAGFGGEREPDGAATGKGADEEGPATFDLTAGGLVGLSAYYNELTYGVVPSLFRDRVIGTGLDAAARVAFVEVGGQILFTTTKHLQRFGAATEYGLGGHVQLGIHIPDTGFTPAYRFAVYNPRIVPADGDVASLLDDEADYDRVMHHTVGVRYMPESLPLGAWLEYTHSIEQGPRAVDNDRVELALQVSFE